MAERFVHSSSSLSSSANLSIASYSPLPGFCFPDQHKSNFIKTFGKFGSCSCDRNGFRLPDPKVSSQIRFTCYRFHCNGHRINRSSQRTWVRGRKSNHAHVLRRRSVCNSALKDFLRKNDNLSAEESSKQRDRKRQAEFLSLCAQVMIAAQVTHMPLLPFLYKNWPGIVDKLNDSVGSKLLLDKKTSGSGILNTFTHKEAQKTFDSSMFLRIASMGLGLFVVASLAFKFSLGIESVVDVGILSCILYSLVFFVTFVVQGISVVLSITMKGELLSELAKWFNLVWLSVTTPIAKILNANSITKPRKQLNTSKYSSFLLSLLK